MVQAIDIITASTLAVIMFSIGSSLTPADFKRILKRPQEVGLGLLLQIVLLPLIAFIIAELWNLPAEAKIGLVILAACPGGSTSNFISYLVKADAALSISMTVVNSFITLVSIPLFVNLALKRYLETSASIQLPFLQTLLSIVFIVIVPAVLGVLARQKWEKPIQKSQKGIKIASILLLGIMFSIKFFADTGSGGSGLTSQAIWTLLPAVLLLHLLALFIGYIIAKLARFNQKSSTTIGIEVGLQNTTLAILVAGTLLQNEAMLGAALVYAMFSFFTTTGFGFVLLRNKITRKKQKVY
jgi:BASS family bile acid:Na+ symporter